MKSDDVSGDKERCRGENLYRRLQEDKLSPSFPKATGLFYASLSGVLRERKKSHYIRPMLQEYKQAVTPALSH